jgi:hypothetical protein
LTTIVTCAKCDGTGTLVQWNETTSHDTLMRLRARGRGPLGRMRPVTTAEDQRKVWWPCTTCKGAGVLETLEGSDRFEDHPDGSPFRSAPHSWEVGDGGLR